jgi:DNA-binding SARP family transcriptional activator
MLSVWLLGGFQIRYDEALVMDIDTPRLQSILAYLMLHRDAPQSRAYLAFLFWPDTTETQARTNLRNLLHNLRHSLPNADNYLDIHMQTLQWRSSATFALDVVDFYTALARADQASQANDFVVTREALEQAVALYKGDLLPSCYDDWILLEREGLRQAYLRALERLVRILEEQRDYQAAIHIAQRIVRYDPLHEATYRSLIRLHALNDDRAGALRVYHTCATLLQRELNIEPSATTREIYEQLLGAESQPSPMVTSTTAFSPLVGREREWAQMLQTWRTVVAGTGSRVLMLRGEAGVGKTRLAEDLLQWAVRQGITCANARCYAAEGEMAYAPVIEWLRAHPVAPLEDVRLVEVARLLPEILAKRLDLPRPVTMTETWQRQRFEEALAHAILSNKQPLLLTVDDLQWCDQDTMEWLHFLLRFDRKARMLIVGTFRPEEIGEKHPLVSLLRALRPEGRVTEIDLQPLNEVATRTLATSVAGVAISIDAAQLLYQETEGNPLFIVETVRAGLPVYDKKLNTRIVQKLHRESLLGTVDLPPKIRSVLEARLAQVSPPSRELAELAATIGREFSFELLEKASGCDEDTLVRELDELWQRHIVREHGTDGYDFSHDKLREVAYSGMSTARCRMLHRHVAQALKTLHTADLDSVSYQLASQYERAGLSEQAIPLYLRAAKVARQVYANEEAIALLQRGITLVENFKSSAVKRNFEVIVHLWEELGDILELKAQHEEALKAYQSAQAHITQGDPIWQARLHRKTGAVSREQRLYTKSLNACRRAEIVLGKQPVEDTDHWWDEWLEVQVERVWAHYWLAQWPEMDTLVNEVQAVFQERGSVTHRVRFLMVSCLMQLRRERYKVSDKMLSDSREALSASREWGDLRVITDCQFELGFLHLWRLELDEAEENLQAVLKMVKAYGIVPLWILTLTYLTVLYRFRGQIDEVLNYSLQAQEAAKAAQMPEYVAAAKGNLAWIAWRRRDLLTTEQRGQEALVLWRQSPLVYPFQWQALWPLIAVALAQKHEYKAWDYTKALLKPTQQLLPDILSTSLKKAVQAKAKGQVKVAQIHLNRAIESAQEIGYL